MEAAVERIEGALERPQLSVVQATGILYCFVELVCSRHSISILFLLGKMVSRFEETNTRIGGDQIEQNLCVPTPRIKRTQSTTKV
jgi:hypothetical protein